MSDEAKRAVLAKIRGSGGCYRSEIFDLYGLIHGYEIVANAIGELFRDGVICTVHERSTNCDRFYEVVEYER